MQFVEKNIREDQQALEELVREMAKGIGVKSTNTIFLYVRGMISAGILEKVDGKLCMVEGKWDYEPEDSSHLVN